jgi:hypothetical protein
MEYRMKKLSILILAVLTLPITLMAQGQSDTTILSDYIASFFSRSMSGYSTPWDLDPDSSNVKQAINDALLLIATHPQLEDATEAVDTIVTDSSKWYNLPSDFMGETWVSIADPTKNGEIGLTAILKSDIGHKTTSEDKHPRYYAIFAKKIFLDPNNTTGDTVNIYYRPYSAKLTTDSSISNVSKKYFNLAVDLAIVDFFSGRTGADVANVLGLANGRIAAEVAALGIKPESILPNIK